MSSWNPDWYLKLVFPFVIASPEPHRSIWHSVFIFGSKVSQVSASSKVPSCDGGFAFSPPGFLLRCNTATVCVLFSASLPASLRSHVLTHENRSTCARQTWISPGQLHLVCHSVVLLHLQHLPLWLCEIFISKRSTKGWLAYEGQWQMQSPLSFQTSLVCDF